MNCNTYMEKETLYALIRRKNIWSSYDECFNHFFTIIKNKYDICDGYISESKYLEAIKSIAKKKANNEWEREEHCKEELITIDIYDKNCKDDIIAIVENRKDFIKWVGKIS